MGFPNRRLTHQDELREIMSEAQDMGVILHLDVLDEADLWLCQIERTTGLPGAGAEVLAIIKDYADEHAMAIHGSIVHDHERLACYYEEQGFSVHPEGIKWRIEYPG